MKISSRILSLLLAVTLIFSIMPIAFAAEATATETDVLSALGNSIAVMDFGCNVIINGTNAPISITDSVTKNEAGSIAPISFFQNVLGATVAQEEGKLNVTYDGTTADLAGLVTSYDGVDYLPLNSALKKLGKTSKTVDMVTIIGTRGSINAVTSSSALLSKLQEMLNVRNLTSSQITDEEWTEVKDKWRKYLLGDKNNDASNSTIKSKLNSRDSIANSRRNKMRKETTVLDLFENVGGDGLTPITKTTQMSNEYASVLYMAQAYGTYGCSNYKSEELLNDILFALDWLYENLYGPDEIDGNASTGWKEYNEYDWWDWCVGVPNYLCDILLIIENDIDKTLVEKYLAPYEFIRSKLRTQAEPAAAASRVYAATASAALREDFDDMNAMRADYDLMLESVESGNGVQEDGLYITHDYFAYSAAYGSTSLLDRLVKIESILSGTSFEFATPNKYNSCKWMYETFAPIMFNGAITGAQSGRFKGTDTFSEQKYIYYAIGAMVDLVGAFGKDDDVKLKKLIKRNVVDENIDDILYELEIDQASKLLNILNDTSVTTEPYYKSKVYYTGDSVVHQRDDFGFALSMSSSRIAAWESIGGQNMTGWYQGDGMLYTYNADDPLAYNRAYWQNVNPYHLPGTTVDTQTRQVVSIQNSYETLTGQDFVGGAELDSKYSTAAMQLESYHKNKSNPVTSNVAPGGDAPNHNSTLMAKKAWFMFDDEVVALGADIDANDSYEVQTVVENRRLNGKNGVLGSEDITVDGTLLEKAETYKKTYQNPTWVNLEGTGGYYFPQGGKLVMDKVTNTDNFLEMWFSHGVSPQNGTYSYVVLPKKSVEETEAYSQAPDIEILSNTEKLQVVKENNLGVTGMVFWENGSYGDMTVSQPMILMTEDNEKEYKLSISDPTKLLTNATVTLNGVYNLKNCDERISVTNNNGNTVISVNFDGSKGRSLPVALAKITDPKPADYVGVAYENDFSGYADDVFKTGLTMLASQSNGMEVTITSDTTGLAGGENQGKFAKIVTPVTDSTKLDHWFRIAYRSGGPVQKAGYELEDFKKTQVSFDICPSRTDELIDVVFYNNYGNEGTTLEKDSLLIFNENGKLYFTGSDVTVDYNANQWLSFDFYFDFTGESGTYSVYLDGNAVVKDVSTTNLVKCVESVSFNTAQTAGEGSYTYYVDNLRIAANVTMPADLEGEIFYEDFTGGFTASDFNVAGVTATTVDNSTATGLTGSEDKGEFVKVDFNSGTSNYFRIRYDGTNTALDKSGYQLSDLGKMQLSFDFCPTTTEIEHTFRFFDQFSASSTKADSLVNFKSGKIQFNNGGSYVSTVDYAANEWVSIDLFLTFTGTSGSYDAYVNGHRVIKGAATTNLVYCVEGFGSPTGTPSSNYTYYLDNLRIAAIPKLDLESNPANGAKNAQPTQNLTVTFTYDIADGFDASTMVTLVDVNSNEVPFTASANGKVITVDPTNTLELNSQYTLTIKKNIPLVDDKELAADAVITFTTTAADLHEGYTSTIANLDFEGHTENDTITRGTEGPHDATGTYYITSGSTATIVKDADESYGLVASQGASVGLGVARVNSQKYATYVANGKYPDLMKVEVDMKRTSGAGYLYVGGTTTGNEVVLWSGNHYFQFRYNDGSDTGVRAAATTLTIGSGEWAKFTIYFDFTNRVHYIYVNGSYMGKFDTHQNITDAELVYTSFAAGGYTDNLSITTVPAYAVGGISEIANEYGEKKLGYAYFNNTGAAANAMLVIADYAGRKELAQAVAERIAVAKSKYGFVTVDSPGEKAAGNTRKAYLWNGFDTMVPLINPIEF